MASERPRPPLRQTARFLLPFWFLGLLACATDTIRRFPLRDPMWVDPDANPVTTKLPKRYTSGTGNTAEHTVLRPLSDALALPLPNEALNVNSLDEVPNSSWFTNRIGLFPMTPDEVARGSCGETPPLDPHRGPWIVVSGKTDGSNPGFVIKAPDGQRYLIKMDGALRSQRATAADVVGSKIYHAAGYHTPCNEIVHFSENILQLDAAAKHKDPHGNDVALTAADVEQILSAGWRDPNGLVRALASRYLAGSPIGPFRYEGTRSDDPNDVIPHERRRELRANRLFSAWIHHWDATENNTLDMMVKENDRTFVRHHMLDWGDAIGDVGGWTWKRLDRRVGIGRSGWLDLDYVFVDFVTLGLYPRPWYRVPTPPSQPETFGYFGTQDFVPSKWRGTLRNPAFSQMTARDALWAARIIARFSDAHISAIVKTADLDDGAATFLTDALMGRRDIILREYLTQSSPLDRFSLTRPGPESATQSLCFEDLAITTKVSDPGSTMYRAHLHGGERLEQFLGWRQFRPDPAHPTRSCVPLPFNHVRPHDLAGAAAPDDHPLRYAELEIYTNQQPSLQPTSSVVVHLYDLGPRRGFRIVGLERPDVVKDPP